MKMQTQDSMGIMVNKELARKRELQKLNEFLKEANNKGGSSGLSHKPS